MRGVGGALFKGGGGGGILIGGVVTKGGRWSSGGRGVDKGGAKGESTKIGGYIGGAGLKIMASLLLQSRPRRCRNRGPVARRRREGGEGERTRKWGTRAGVLLRTNCKRGNQRLLFGGGRTTNEGDLKTKVGMPVLKNWVKRY